MREKKLNEESKREMKKKSNNTFILKQSNKANIC